MIKRLPGHEQLVLVRQQAERPDVKLETFEEHGSFDILLNDKTWKGGLSSVGFVVDRGEFRINHRGAVESRLPRVC